MSKDLREIIKTDIQNSVELSTNHRQRFQQKLLGELHQKTEAKKSHPWLYVAASIALLLGLVVSFYFKNTTVTNGNEVLNEIQNQIRLGTISPELKTVEDYYINTINYELSQLELTDNNKELFDGYLTKIGELTKEYKSLTQELNTKGVNDDTIIAWIGNLLFLLQLLKRMQKQLQEFKNPTQNEIQTI